MTKLSNIAFILGAAACAHRLPLASPTTTYECTDTAIVSHDGRIELRDRGASLTGSPPARVHFERRDGDATYFTARSNGDAFATEYIVPNDPRQDALARIVDPHNPERLVRRDVCVARGGYTDALAHYLRGESLEQVASDLSLVNRDAARDLVHHAMLVVQRRYFREH